MCGQSGTKGSSGEVGATGSVEDDTGQIDDAKPWAIDPRIYCGQGRLKLGKETHTWKDGLLILFQSARWMMLSRWSGNETSSIKMCPARETRFDCSDGVGQSRRGGLTPQPGWPSRKVAPEMVEKSERHV